MITGGSAWNSALATQGYLPDLYTVELAGLGPGGGALVLCSFVPSQVSGIPSGAIQAIHQDLFEGGSQNISELDGHSDISGFEVRFIDPTNTLKPLIPTQAMLGVDVAVKLGFWGLPYSDFVLMHTMQVLDVNVGADGVITLGLEDPLRSQVQKVFAWGGPNFWAPGLPTPQQPVGENWIDNGQRIGSDNPLWLQGNPIDLIFAVCQNYLGYGQASSNQTSWQLYEPGVPSTLINPNPDLDVPGALALQAQYLSGDWCSFRLIDSVPDAKSWIEREIMKPFGLYWIARASGHLALKYIHQPVTSVATIGQGQIVSQGGGIPEIKQLDIENVLTARMDTDQSQSQGNSSANAYDTTWPFYNVASIDTYKQQRNVTFESKGLQADYGGLVRAQLFFNRMSERHAFGAPTYRMRCSFGLIGLELGDGVSVTDPVLLNMAAPGGYGVSGILCEVIDRKPLYSQGVMELLLLDTRFLGLETPFTITPPAQTAYPGTSSSGQFFICANGGTATNPTANTSSVGGQCVIY